MESLSDYSVSATFIGVEVAILVIAAEMPYSLGTLNAQISVVPLGKGVVERYKTGSAHLAEVTIFANLSSTKSSRST